MNILEAINIGKQYKKDISVIFIGPINDSNLQRDIKNYIEKMIYQIMYSLRVRYLLKGYGIIIKKVK
ncbi:hypothetical protein JTT07_13165 [Clostridium botulinum]|nr:hypothetical protein [Clostridium botulinum]